MSFPIVDCAFVESSAMNVNVETLKSCFLVSRLSFLSCWRLEKSDEKWVAKCSKVSVLANVSMAGFLSYIFIKMVNLQNQPTIYKYSSLVFPLFTEFIIVLKVIFIFCGNYYLRKFVDVINFFPPFVKRLGSVFPSDRFRWQFKSKTILRTWVTVVFGLSFFLFYIEYHMVLSYPRILRFVYFFLFYCVAAFSLNFAVAMDYIRVNYVYLNFLFGKILSEARKKTRENGKDGSAGGSTSRKSNKKRLRRNFRIWMTSFMELRQVEDMVNDVFGKKIFIMLVLSFCAIIMNLYYFGALNFYQTGTVWLNLCFSCGTIETIVLLYTTISAAEKASREANKINQVLLSFPLVRDDWYYYKQIRYFKMFLNNYPIQFRAWVFYTLNYSLFFKLLAVSFAISIVLLQCEFMRQKAK